MTILLSFEDRDVNILRKGFGERKPKSKSLEIEKKVKEGQSALQDPQVGPWSHFLILVCPNFLA